MAVTLESLSLEVNASAEGASSTINSLIGSLTALDKVLTSPLSKLKELNTALKSIANTSTTKIATAVSGGSGGGRAKKPITPTPSVLKEFEKTYKNGFAPWTYGPNPLPTVSHYNGSSSMIPEEEMRKLHPEWYRDESFYQQKHEEQVDRMARRLLASQPSTPANEVTNAVSGVAPAAQQAQQAMQATAPAVKETKQALQETAPAATQAASAIKEVGRATSEAGNECKKVNPVVAGMNKAFKSVGKGIDRVGRMMSTMLIRTALKSLIKHFGESWAAAYEFSKHMGGEFYQAVDKAKTLMMGASTSIVTAFAPAFQAMIPVINAVVNGIRYLCSAIQWLFSLLGMSSEFLGASTDAINKYSGAAKGGGSATKDLLASFDELNVIQSQGGGGGGGGGVGAYKNGMFSDIVSDEMAKLQLIVGESMLAIGLILACTGHLGVGLGLMAVGAGAIAKTLVADWGQLSNDMQRELVGIMGIIGVSLLAIGAILAFSGANIPLGIGLMIAGAGNLYAAYKLNWDALKTQFASLIGKLSVWLVARFREIRDKIADVLGRIWDKVSAWASDMWEGLKLAWDKIPEFFQALWDTISTAAGEAWKVVCQFWDSTIKPGIAAVWGIVSNWFINTVWEPLKENATKAFDVIKLLWDKEIKPNLSKVWGSIASWFMTTVFIPLKRDLEPVIALLSTLWDKEIKPKISKVWGTIASWFMTTVFIPLKKDLEPVVALLSALWDKEIKPKLSAVWGTVSNWFYTTVFSPLMKHIASAYDKLSLWWEDKRPAIAAVWGVFASWFETTVWKPVKEAIEPVWNILKAFYETNFKEKIEKAWQGVKDVFTAAFTPIRDAWDWIQGIFGGGKTANYNVNINTNGKSSNSPFPEHIYVTSGSSKTTTGATSGLISGIGALLKNGKASGAFGIPQGDVFVANEAGAEMIGTLNGRTTVANQEQIVEGIRRGLEGANEQQNRLLQQQNELLRQLLEKDSSVRIGASAALGRVVAQSQQMYARQAGG